MTNSSTTTTVPISVKNYWPGVVRCELSYLDTNGDRQLYVFYAPGKTAGQAQNVTVESAGLTNLDTDSSFSIVARYGTQANDTPVLNKTFAYSSDNDVEITLGYSSGVMALVSTMLLLALVVVCVVCVIACSRNSSAAVAVPPPTAPVARPVS